MTSNLLCVTSAKTEFFLLGLKPQLNRIHNPTLLIGGHSVPPTVSARFLGFSFEEGIDGCGGKDFDKSNVLRRVENATGKVNKWSRIRI